MNLQNVHEQIQSYSPTIHVLISILDKQSTGFVLSKVPLGVQDSNEATLRGAMDVVDTLKNKIPVVNSKLLPTVITGDQMTVER